MSKRTWPIGPSLMMLGSNMLQPLCSGEQCAPPPMERAATRDGNALVLDRLPGPPRRAPFVGGPLPSSQVTEPPSSLRWTGRCPTLISLFCLRSSQTRDHCAVVAVRQSSGTLGLSRRPRIFCRVFPPCENLSVRGNGRSGFRYIIREGLGPHGDVIGSLVTARKMNTA